MVSFKVEEFVNEVIVYHKQDAIDEERHAAYWYRWYRPWLDYMWQDKKSFITFGMKGVPDMKVEFELYKDVPKTSYNFLMLCSGEQGWYFQELPFHFKGTKVHRIIKDCLI